MRGGGGAAARHRPARLTRLNRMNAPLPRNLQLEPAGKVYDSVARVSQEVAGKLAAGLRQHTQGEVLFTAADCGRYDTDASIY